MDTIIQYINLILVLFISSANIFYFFMIKKPWRWTKLGIGIVSIIAYYLFYGIVSHDIYSILTELSFSLLYLSLFSGSVYSMMTIFRLMRVRNWKIMEEDEKWTQ